MGRTVALNANAVVRSTVKTFLMLVVMLRLSWELTVLTCIEMPLLAVVQNKYSTLYKVGVKGRKNSQTFHYLFLMRGRKMFVCSWKESRILKVGVMKTLFVDPDLLSDRSWKSRFRTAKLRMQTWLPRRSVGFKPSAASRPRKTKSGDIRRLWRRCT